jgi:hypothetical protein
MDSNCRKDGTNKFGWKEWGEKCSFFLQVARMILDVKGLIN